MSKLLVISPKYIPLKDGLAGHTYYLTKCLKEDFNLDLLTDHTIPPSTERLINVLPIIRSWNFTHLYRNWNPTNKDYDSILIQYVPSLYNSRGGINFSILLFFLYLKFIKNKKVGVIFHELYYPRLSSWKAWVLHYCHRIMFFFTLMSCDKAFFSTNNYASIAKSYTFNHKKLIHLPVGASIETDFTPHPLVTNNSYVLFGGYHPSKNYQLIFDTFEKSFKDNIRFSLTIIGANESDLSKVIKLPKNYLAYTRFRGKLEDEEVIKVFKRSQYLISYFSDGVSTRRSSVISALGNGLQIITTKSNLTEEVFLNQSSVTLLPTDEDLFSKKLIQIIKSPKQTQSRQTIEFYKSHFDWSNTRKLLKFHLLSSF